MKRLTMKVLRLSKLILVLMVIAMLVSPAALNNKSVKSYIVQATSTQEAARLVSAYGGTVTSHLEVIKGVGALLPEEVVPKLRTEPQIKAVHQNALVQVAGSNDVLPTTDYPNVVGANVVWQQGVTGMGVTVAVVDTGVANHPGLVKNINKQRGNHLLAWVDFVDGSRKPKDPNGHGTHIAGIIANTQVGADGEWNGVAPGARLVGVRVLDANGNGTYERVIQGIQWVIQNKAAYHIRVMNLSLVALVQSPYFADPLNQAIMQAWAQGITVVVAAGNGGPDAMSISVPGNNPYVITVGAFTDNYTPMDWQDDYVVPFSAAGPTLDGFAKPDVVAPGAHMVSPMLNNSKLSRAHPENRLPMQYFSNAGTSQAAAVVSGIAALTLSRQPNLTPNQVKYRIQVTSFPWVDMDTTEALYSLWQQGAGRVNAPDAVNADVSGTANSGLDIAADLADTGHFQGYSYFDETTNMFRLHGDYESWDGGYGAWAGNYEARTGGYGAWAGGYGAWAGGYGAWAGGYGAWAGGYGAWAGGYGVWAGGYGVWAGGYGVWAGGYGTWPGGYGVWAGSFGDADFAGRFSNWRDEFGDWDGNLRWTGSWTDFDG